MVASPAWTITEPRIGVPAIGDVDAAARIPNGAVVRAHSDTYGDGEFIYLKTVSNTLQGSMVTYDTVITSGGTATYQTALCPSTANLGKPVAFAVNADSAGGNNGWYQIGGYAIAQAGTFTSNGTPYIGSAGVLTTTSASGKQVLGAAAVASAGFAGSGLAVVEIDRPHTQGGIT